MSPAHSESPLLIGGQPGRFYISIAQHGGWDVHVKVADRVIARAHCPEWRHVELFRMQVELKFRGSRNSPTAHPAAA